MITVELDCFQPERNLPVGTVLPYARDGRK